MDINLFSCYYPGCDKQYQSISNLIRHINTSHLDQVVLKCQVCSKFLETLEEYHKHKEAHKRKSEKKNSSVFLLSEHYEDQFTDISPHNILKFPVLPPIENDRKDFFLECKLPMSPDLLAALMRFWK